MEEQRTRTVPSTLQSVRRRTSVAGALAPTTTLVRRTQSMNPLRGSFVSLCWLFEDGSVHFGQLSRQLRCSLHRL